MPPKKKAKADRAKEIEERRKALEEEKLKKEREMQALLAEQEALLSKLANCDDDGDDDDEEGEVGDSETPAEESERESPKEGGEITTGEESAKESSKEGGEITTGDESAKESSKERGEITTGDESAKESSKEGGEITTGDEMTTGDDQAIVKVAVPEPESTEEEGLASDSQPESDTQATSAASKVTTQPVVTSASAPKVQIIPNRCGMPVVDDKYHAFANRLFGNLYKERETKFFIVKSANKENIDLAFHHKVWATTSVNEIRWNEAYMAHTNVLLVFSVQGSGAFQGLARIANKSSRILPAVSWVLPPKFTVSSIAAVFQIDWISRQEFSFDKCSHLRNTWNRNKLVKVARDGQEINWRTGCALSLLFPLDGSCEYDMLLGKMKRKRTEIGPNQAVTASSRSARRRKNLNKPTRAAVGVNPQGYKRGITGGRGGGPASKRQRTGDSTMTGANTAPLGNQAPITHGVTSLFNL